MNKELQEARARFRGQKGKISTGYDNSPIPEGNYTARIVQSDVRTRDVQGEKAPCHCMRLQIEDGELKGRNLFPFSPRLDTQEGVISSARYISRILGDVLPGRKLANGEFELDFSAYLAQSEELIAKCIGLVVSVTVKDSNRKRADGTVPQNVYINRALGDDAQSDKGSEPATERVEGRLPRRTRVR